MFGERYNANLLTEKKNDRFSFSGNIFQSDNYQAIKDVIIFDEFLTSNFCQLFVSFFSKQTEWKKSVTYGEQDGSQSPETSPRQSSQIILAGIPEADKFVFEAFSKALSIYRTIYPHVHVTSDEGYSLLRYTEGGKYSAHVDRGAPNNRVVSGLIYLNDDFEGGELHFPRQELTIKPKPGSLVLFPSFHTFEHASLPIKSGTKYAVVTWFY